MIYATGDRVTTHAGLVSRAVRWLRNTCGCGVIITKGTVCVSEQPDAIGFRGSGNSLLVECKVSRADFFRDAEKEHRRLAAIDSRQGIGNERWYLTRPCLVTLAEIPADWGLAECYPNAVRVRLPAPWHAEKASSNEICLLLASIRRGTEEWSVPLNVGCVPDVGL